jgi:Gamma-aminobutyrate permease and related permeases
LPALHSLLYGVLLDLNWQQHLQGLLIIQLKTIPKAVVLGTVCVAVIYFINNFAIMGLINGNNLASSRAPYVDAIKIMFSGNWHLIVSIVAFIFCVGSLNAWVLSSGQVAFGLAEDRLMPKFFAKRNKHGSPFWGITVSSIGTAILLILTSNNNFAQQITSIIDFFCNFIFCSFILRAVLPF